MGSAKHACNIYCQGCSSKREKKNKSPIVPSFFKIMRGISYDVCMVVPPTVADKLKSLLVKKVTLEDSDSRKWDVRLTNLEGSLAFQKGWRNFVQGNGIVEGDFLEFNYFDDSRFLVDIYGSNGCPKSFPSVTRMRNDAKRTAEIGRSSNPSASKNIGVAHRLEEEYYAENPFGMARNFPSQSNIHRTPKVVPVSKTFEDPCFMTSRETNADVEDDRESLLDLSAFEMRSKKPTIDRENDWPEKETDVNATVRDNQHERRSSFVSDKFHNTESGAASTNTETLSGGSTRPIKQEAAECKPDILSGEEAMTDSCPRDEHFVKVYCVEGCCKNFNQTLNDEPVVKTSMKSEPVDCEAPSQPL